MVLLPLHIFKVMARAFYKLSEMRTGTHYIFGDDLARIKRVDTTNLCEQSAAIIHRKPACGVYADQFVLKMRIGLISVFNSTFVTILE